MKDSKDKGFSLVELIIVVAIMAVLVGVLAPQYIKYVERSRAAADEDNAQALLDTAHVIMTDQGQVDKVDENDSITFSVDGVDVDCSKGGLQDGLAEYMNGYTSMKIVSKTYQGQKYVIKYVKGGMSKIFTLEYGWEAKE